MQTSTPGSAGKRNLIKALAAGALLAVGVGGYFSLSAHKPAPAVEFTALDGSKISADSLRGKVVMVNFWATSCTTCVAEMPHMVETYNKYRGQGLEFVAVAMSYDPPDYVRNYAQSRQLPFKVALDASGAAASAFGDVKLTPTTFVIDKQGKILKRYVGEPQFAELHQLLEKALAA
jgi:peroxiredoxin